MPKSGDPWLFIPTACRIRSFGIVRVLVFPITAYINIFFAFFYRNIHCLTSEFHGKFHARNRYCKNHAAMSALTVKNFS